jgi:hypothetical protein
MVPRKLDIAVIFLSLFFAMVEESKNNIVTSRTKISIEG